MKANNIGQIVASIATKHPELFIEFLSMWMCECANNQFSCDISDIQDAAILSASWTVQRKKFQLKEFHGDQHDDPLERKLYLYRPRRRWRITPNGINPNTLPVETQIGRKRILATHSDIMRIYKFPRIQF